MKFRPFRDGDTFATFQNLVEKIKAEINGLENEYMLKASVTELEQYFLDKAKIKPIVLHADKYYIENQSSTQIDVSHDFNRAVFPGERAIIPGTCVVIAIPYEGDSGLWKIQPSTFTLSGYPEIEVCTDRILLTFSFPDDSADSKRLKKQIESQVESLVGAVNYLKRDVENHNNSISNIIKTAIENKRQKALSATNAVANLGIPIRQKNMPPEFTAPVKRRSLPVQRPLVSVEKYKPEPVLDDKEYEHILNVLRSMSLVIERSPHSFVTLDEEAIRTHFLLQLNGHYEGGASGETFNASGKTDILIRIEDRNIFIAECKFWRGQKAFAEAIDQLLSYLSWRDSKCALLIFNKTKDSSAVRQRMHEAMEGHPEYRKTVKHEPNGDSKYIFVKKSDPGREIIITTQLFDIPQFD
ncbi:MAG: hypothetical protein A2173_05960 [Planctomycetes bacterium RBG_13_44_8b]|nr:MAG: hypothetical protein A2173_05960 [Planctomycetes bacterium RBG_13_44_8b]